MNIYEFGPLKALVSFVYWLVTRLGILLEPLAGTASAALAVIALTILVRIALIPVGLSQVKANLVRRRLAPKVRKLQERYGKNPEVLRRKLAELYREEKASPLAGCLPVLAQTPVLMAVYGVFITPNIDGAPNGLLTHELFGVPLGASLTGLIGSGAVSGAASAVFLALIALIALVALGSRRLITGADREPAQRAPIQPPANTGPGRPGTAEIPPGPAKVLSFMPFLTAVIAAFAPLAAGLYLLTTTAWTLGERVLLTRIYRDREKRHAAPNA